MTVLRFRPHSDPDAFLPNSFLQARCYFCAERLSSPFILWMGAGDPLALHPRCVVELSIRLLRDVHQVEHETGNEITAPKPEPAQQLAALRERLAARKEVR